MWGIGHRTRHPFPEAAGVVGRHCSRVVAAAEERTNLREMPFSMETGNRGNNTHKEAELPFHKPTMKHCLQAIFSVK